MYNFRPKFRDICRIFLIATVTIVVLLMCGVTYQTIAANIDAQNYPPVGTIVSTKHGEFHSFCVGEKGPLVLFEAGAGGSLLDWSLVQSKLSKDFRSCSYDRLGLGWSKPSLMPRTGQNLNQELSELLKQIGETGPVIAVGHSFGGLLMQQFTRQHPDKVIGLVLVDSTHEDLIENLPIDMRKQRPAQLNQLRLGRYVTRLGISRLLNLAALPASMPDSIAPAVMSRAFLPENVQTIYEEAIHFEQTVDEIKSSPPLSERIPIGVVSRKSIIDQNANSFEIEWQRLQKKLANLTENTTHWQSAKTDHYVQLSEPELIVEAIKSVAEKVMDRDRF